MERGRSWVWSWLSMAIIGVTIIIFGIIIGHSVRHRNDGPRTVSVKGSAERNFVSDLAVWDIQIRHRSASPVEGLRVVEQQSETIFAFLQEAGFSIDEIELGAITYNEDINSYYNRDQERYVEEHNGYNLYQVVSVTTNDVDRVKQTSHKVGELIERNVTAYSYAPRYYYTKLADLKLEMLGEAAKDARSRAEQIAKESNGRVGALKQSNMGVFQILGKYSDENYSWGGTLNTSDIEKTVNITVTSVFLLD